MSTITKVINNAVNDLLAGKPVAIPTETVYGLAAPINNKHAIEAVFQMKNRPLNHPLIVHVAPDWDLNQIVEYIPDYAKRLIAHFWPGPLTIVFRMKERALNPLITGNQRTVAIRCPNHPIALELLNKLGTPLVAPSANPFGKVSPTTAEHVAQSFSEEELTILDGGRCTVGIESTIVDATQSQGFQILRHGHIDERTLSSVANAPCLDEKNELRVPGKLDSHYQPEKNLYYFSSVEELHAFCQKRAGETFVIANTPPMGTPKDLYHPFNDHHEKAAFDLYYQLRRADNSSAMCIAIELPPNKAPWLGVRERILKAGRPYAQT